jgi:hypothetical protein
LDLLRNENDDGDFLYDGVFMDSSSAVFVLFLILASKDSERRIVSILGAGQDIKERRTQRRWERYCSAMFVWLGGDESNIFRNDYIISKISQDLKASRTQIRV